MIFTTKTVIKMKEIAEEPEKPETDKIEVTNDKESNVDNGNDNEHSTTSAKIPQKQKFETFDAVLDENNYKDAPSQGDFSLEYSDSKKTMKMTWK